MVGVNSQLNKAFRIFESLIFFFVFFMTLEIRAEGILLPFWQALYLIVPVTILLRFSSFIHTARKDLLLWLLTGLAAISIYWSVVPKETSMSSCFLTLSLLLGIYIAMRFSFEKQLSILMGAILMAAALSLFVIFMFPSVGRGRGIHLYKNMLGPINLLGIIVFLQMLRIRRYRLISQFGFGLSLFLIIYSRSITSLFGLFFILVLYLLYNMLKSRQWGVLSLLILLVILVGIFGQWLLINLGDILRIFGKDATLTGRIPLWERAMEFGIERPWLGYGFKAFWSEETYHIQYWQDMRYWAAKHAHNGFLQLFLELGFVGFMIFLLSFLINILRAVKFLRLKGQEFSLWPLMFLIYLLFVNIPYTRLMTEMSIYWILYVAMTYTLAVELRRGRKFFLTYGSNL